MKTPNEIFIAVSEIVPDYSMLLPKVRAGYRPYIFGQIVKPYDGSDNGHYYRCTTAGITGLSEPAWPVSGNVPDGSVVWTEAGMIADTIGNRLLSFINECIHIVAVNVDLPALEKEPTDLSTTTSTNHVPLPVDYHRDLFLCMDSNGLEIKIYPNIQIMQQEYQDTFGSAGSVEAVAIRGDQLYYQYVPETAETLSLSYFKKPTEVTVLTSPPSDLLGVDDYIADLLQIEYVSYKIFDLIEMADAPRPNRDSHLAAFNAILAKQKVLNQGSTKRIDSFRG